jgi:hypothetical protein
VNRFLAGQSNDKLDSQYFALLFLHMKSIDLEEFTVISLFLVSLLSLF